MPLPTPSVTYGAVMSHDDRTGAMVGFKYGGAVGDAHAAHAAHAAPGSMTATAAAAPSMAGMQHGASVPPADTVARKVRALHDAMMRDVTIRNLVMADPALRAQQQSLESIGAVASVARIDPAARQTKKQPGAKAPPK